MSQGMFAQMIHSPSIYFVAFLSIHFENPLQQSLNNFYKVAASVLFFGNMVFSNVTII